jgi:biofilm PGA synthesis N-glycosyltransferase PgaC
VRPPVTTATRDLSYVLITAARNEEAFIEQTITSVIRQTVLPLAWVIVSDGSTDGTDDIVRKHAAEHAWISLIRTPARAERHFEGKVRAFNMGYSSVKHLSYDIIGNLDADISFDEDYISFLLRKFADNPQLGVGGTPFREGSAQYDYRFSSTEHVSGACQLFRRSCFEAVGGYVPLKAGGVDLAAVLSARMKGWQTRTFTDKTCEHHKRTQSSQYASVKATFRSGYHDYLMGGHPFWQLPRSVYQMTKRPFLIAGLALFAGYLWAMLRRADWIVPGEVVDFRRKEQMQRLKDCFKKAVLLRGFNPS